MSHRPEVTQQIEDEIISSLITRSKMGGGELSCAGEKKDR